MKKTVTGGLPIRNVVLQLYSILKASFFMAGLFVCGSGGLIAADEGSLTITYYHYPPHIRVKDNSPSGNYIDQLEDVAKRAGYSVKWLASDIDEEAAMLNAGRRPFCTTGRMPSPARAKRWKFLPFLFDVVPGDTVLTRADKVEELSSYASIAEVASKPIYRGALLKSGIYGTEIDIQLATGPNWIVRSAATDMQLMKLVLAGRADWTIVPKQQWQEAMNLHQPTAELVEIPDFGAHPDYPIFIACSNALSPEMFDRLSKAMREAGFKPGIFPN